MGKRGRAQGSYGQPTRILVSEARFAGSLVDWKGQYGWIEPSQPIDHPEAMKNKGMVFLDQKDVVEDLPGIGALVSFLAYVDGSGVGASECCAAHEEEVKGQAWEGSRKGRYGGGGKAALPALGKGAWRKGNGHAKGGGKQYQMMNEPQEGTIIQWRGRSGFIRPDYPLDEFMGGDWAGDLFFGIDDVVEEIAGVGAAVTFIPYIDMRGLCATNVGPVHAAPEQDHSDVLTRVHSSLSEGVWAAVQLADPVEPSWTPQELSKRLTRYLYKGAYSEDLLSMPWEEAVNQYMDRAMHSYSSACGDRPWFLALDLTQAVGAAAWALVQSSVVRPRPQRAQVLQLVGRGFWDRLHRTRLDKAIWEVLEATVEAEQPVLSKMFGFLSRSYDAALKSVSCDTRPVRGLGRAEAFMRQWMNDSMSRTWTALPEPENLITEDSVAWLFECLLTPFGETDTYCCLPSWLLGGKSRIPKNWDFIRSAVKQLFWSWSQPGQPSKRRKRQQNGEDQEGGLPGELDVAAEAVNGAADGEAEEETALV